MGARELVDSCYTTLDLGEHLEVEGVVLPRFSTWQLNEFGVPVDLIALSKILPTTKKPISEAKVKFDRDEVLRVVRKELKAAKKQDKKDDLLLIRNALISLFRTFYTKRSFWSQDISGDRQS